MRVIAKVIRKLDWDVKEGSRSKIEKWQNDKILVEQMEWEAGRYGD